MSKNLTLAVPAFLAVSVVAASLGVMTSGSAADECLRAPKGAAPEGRHWYYRVDRSTGRHCWYLGAKGLKVRQSSSRSSSRKRAAPEREPAAPVKKTVAPPAPEPVVRSAEPATPPARRSAALPNELPVSKAPIATRFSQFWPSLRAPIDMAQQPVAPAGTNYAEEPANAQHDVPPELSALPETVPETRARAPAAPVVVIKTEQMLAILVGALSLAGLIMALTYKLATLFQRPQAPTRRAITASEARMQLQPFGHTGALPRPAAAPAHKSVIAKRASDLDLDREPHESRRLRELNELRQDLESRLEELRHARRRSAA